MTTTTTTTATVPVDPSTPLPFFVYGTLRPGWGNSRCWLGTGFAEHDGAATVTGLRLVGDGHPFPYAIVTGDEADTAVGAIVRSVPGHGVYGQLLDRLDRLEGYPSHYDRVAVEVSTPDLPVICWAYTVPAHDEFAMARARKMAPIPGGDWSAAHLRGGAR